MERTRGPLLLGDALRDGRYAHDPHSAAHTQRALLVLPTRSQGRLRATLLLENRLARAAFWVHRLDAGELIAWQLAVSLDARQCRAVCLAGAQVTERGRRNRVEGCVLASGTGGPMPLAWGRPGAG